MPQAHFNVIFLVLFTLSFFMWGQETDDQTTSNDQIPDTTEMSHDEILNPESTLEGGTLNSEEQEEASDSEELEEAGDSENEVPTNPFVNESDETSTLNPDESEESFVNPFDEEQETATESESGAKALDESMEAPVNMLVDVGVGISLAKFLVKPVHYVTEGKTSFNVNPGILITFPKSFYTGIGVRYFRCNTKMYNSYDVGTGGQAQISVREDIKETMSFISVPIRLGMRFTIGSFFPYFHADIEPAYLSASGQHIIKELSHTFPDGVIVKETISIDSNTINSREQYHVFIGGGLGIELAYGYGSIYLDVSGLYNVREIIIQDTGTGRQSSRKLFKVIHLPIAIGIRFFL